MIDYYLKFKDEAEALEVLKGYTGSIDVIGLIYKEPGNTLTTHQGEVPEMAPIVGWHVNTRGPGSESLLPFSVQVLTPSRVWA
jgi:hypothetical protein